MVQKEHVSKNKLKSNWGGHLVWIKGTWCDRNIAGVNGRIPGVNWTRGVNRRTSRVNPWPPPNVYLYPCTHTPTQTHNVELAYTFLNQWKSMGSPYHSTHITVTMLVQLSMQSVLNITGLYSHRLYQVTHIWKIRWHLYWAHTDFVLVTGT